MLNHDCHFVNRKEEVDLVTGKAESAGAKVVKAAQVTFWGDTEGTFKIPTDACGRWLGILSCKLKNN